MKTEVGEKILTVKDIAEAIAFDKSHDGICKTIRQVRHWTQSDLIRPLSEKNTGKGIPRFYAEEPTIYLAALLLELTRYGVTVEILKFVADELYAEEFNKDFGPEGWYVQTALTDITSFMQVAWRTDSKTGQFVGAKVTFFDALEMQENMRELINEEASSSVLINMNRVLNRVFPLSWWKDLPVGGA